jgi:DUF971 family protein
MTSAPFPLSLNVAPESLTIDWGLSTSSLTAARLRSICRCAPCQSARLRSELLGPEPGLTLVDAAPIGHYAVNLKFSDGHERGIYPWTLLFDLAD